MALDEIAPLLDEYSVAPFAVTLSEWSIIPHVEAMDQGNIFGTRASHTRGKTRTTTTPEKEERLLSTEDEHEMDDSVSASQRLTKAAASFRRSDRQAAWSRHLRTRNLSPDELETQQLIASEELIGRVKLAERRQKQRLKQEAAAAATRLRNNNLGFLEPSLNETATPTRIEEPIAPPLPQDEWEEFNGPCVICLEPDTASRERLQAVRYLLKHGLSGGVEWAELYSPTSSVTHSKLARTTAPLSATTRRRRGRRSKSATLRDDDPTDFRPVVPIAAFATVASAIPVARKLRQLWQPLTFSVTDLHVLSSSASSSSSGSLKDSEPDKQDDLLDEYYQRKSFASAVPPLPKEKAGSVVGSPPKTTAATADTNQFGCDALIALVGAEMEMDEELNQQMAQWICATGEAGGFARQASSNSTSTAAAVAVPDLNDSVPREGWTENLDKWLRDEDDYDEGTVVVIGRTQLFTGEMRQYVGMPASSALDV
jgi:hypothetical protein